MQVCILAKTAIGAIVINYAKVTNLVQRGYIRLPNISFFAEFIFR